MKKVKEPFLSRKKHGQWLLGASVAAALGCGFITTAQAEEARRFSIPVQDLQSALQSFSKATHINVLFSPDLVKGKNSVALNGKFSELEALNILLAGTGLAYEPSDENTLLIKNRAESANYDNSENSNRKVEDSDRTHNIEEMIVTATRRAQNLQDVPMSLSVVKPDEFRSEGLATLQDVISYTPGFNFRADDRVRGKGAISARGVSQLGGAPVVGVYLDDIAMSSGSSWSAGSWLFFDGLLADVERVEFLKGPQGTLFGATSVGGAVRYITREPALNEARGHVSTDFSYTQDGGLNQLYVARGSFPLIEDRLGVTVSGVFEDTTGYVDRVDATTGETIAANVGGAEFSAYSVDLFYKISDKFQFRGAVLKQTSETSGSSYVNYNQDSTGFIYGARKSDVPDSGYKIPYTVYSGNLKYDFGWGELTSVTGFSDYSGEQSQDLVNYLAIYDFLAGNPEGTTVSLPFLRTDISDRFTQELRLTSSDSEVFEWLVGFYYADESAQSVQYLTAVPEGPLGFDFIARDDNNEYAAFANVTWYLTPRFDISVGSRLSRFEGEFLNTQAGLFAGGAEPAMFTVAQTVDTWLFSTRYRPTENLSLYARVGSGYRPVTYNTLPAAFSDLPIQVSADTLWSYEAGVKGVLEDGLFSYDVSLWYLDWKDFQTGVSVNGYGGIANALGGIDAKGVEGNFNYRPTENLTVSASLTYSESALKEDDPLLGELAGTPVPDVPEWTSALRTRYEFAVSSGVNGHVGGGIRYMGSTPREFRYPASIPVDGYVLVDLSAGFVWDSFGLTLHASNLLDDKSLTRYTAFSQRALVVPPRTVGVQFSYDF